MSKTQINGGEQIQANTITSGQVDTSILVAGGTNAFTADQSMGSHKLTNLATCTTGTDAANKNYVDTTVQGLAQKPTARLATAAALPAGTYANGTAGVGATFSVTATGTLTIDGVVTALGDVILVKNQASAFQNGLYTVTTAGAGGVAAVLTRHVQMDQTGEFDGEFIPVDNEGTANANTLWLVNNLGTVTVGTTNVTFTQLASASSYAADGTTLTLSGTTFSINTSYVGQTSITTLGTITTGTWNGTPLATAYIAANAVTSAKLANAAVGPTQLAAQASGTGLQGGNGSNLAVQVAVRETPSGSINGSNTAFTLAHTPVSGTEEVYLNGVQQDAGAGNDYTISGTTVTMLAAPLSGDKIRVSYFY